MLTQQSVDGRLTDNSVRLIRQELLLGGQVTREDGLAVVNELQSAREQAHRLAGENARLRGLLDELGSDHRANLADAWAEGWSEGANAAVRVATADGWLPEEHQVNVLAAAGHELANPHEGPQLQEVPD